jgi:hypothetical protein
MKDKKQTLTKRISEYFKVVGLMQSPENIEWHLNNHFKDIEEDFALDFFRAGYSFGVDEYMAYIEESKSLVKHPDFEQFFKTFSNESINGK